MSTPDALVPTISALQTEQAALQAILAQTPAPTATPNASPTIQATATQPPLPNPTPAVGILGLRQSLYFLAPDAQGRDQIWRLDPDGTTRTQLTEETRSLTEFDVSNRGDLAYVVWDTPKVVPRLMVQTTDNEPPQVIAELNADGETILHVRWLPDGDRLVFHRSVIIENTNTSNSEPPQTASELVLYNLPQASSKVLLRAGPDPIDPEIGTMFTNESVEFDAMNDWNVVYQVTMISADGRFLLLNDSGGPFWFVYDLNTDSVYHYNIRAVSADLNSNGLFVCLAGVTSEPAYLGKQALLCADVVANSVSTYLETPPWQPFSLDYWQDDNAIVFLQMGGEAGSPMLQVYGMNLNETEPLLLRQLDFTFSDPQTSRSDVLYAPQKDPLNGMVILAGKTPEMTTPGLVLVPLDAKKPVQTIETGQAHQPRWGPIALP